MIHAVAIGVFSMIPSCRAAVFASPGDHLAGGKSPYLLRRVRADDQGLAHRTLPLGSWVKVTNVRTGQSAVVQVIDRGPYGAMHEGKWRVKRRKTEPGKWRGCADLTPATAQAIGHNGFERVRLEKARPAGATGLALARSATSATSVLPGMVGRYHEGTGWASALHRMWTEAVMQPFRSICVGLWRIASTVIRSSGLSHLACNEEPWRHLSGPWWAFSLAPRPGWPSVVLSCPTVKKVNQWEFYAARSAGC